MENFINLTTRLSGRCINIEQIVTRVDHNYKPEHLVRVGGDNESIALAKAVKYHIERRVFLDGNKTVIFHGV